MSYADKTLTCSDCNTSFTFSASEQEFFASKGFTNEPGRCPDCRAARKQQRGGSGGGYSGGSGGGYRQQREMYPAVCASCGKSTQVPFEPRNGRPVYCSDCYSKTKR
ncbi:MAG: zinc-ribbon domain containing protein [Chloroflexi bacterium]|jgi:CxxC-x17-CxxC domain-containing protein|nr:zinc-ribbon domain containing protein [Chloroflexota bacterium]